MFLRLMIGVMLVSSFVGCATAQKPTSVNNLQIRVAQIENRLEENEQDVSDLKYAVEDLVTDVGKLSGSTGRVVRPVTTIPVSSTVVSESSDQQILRVPVTPQEVQTALKNSGHYTGAIDGKLGSGSQRAIKAFQTDHGLQSDGIVGQKTWTELKNYLK